MKKIIVFIILLIPSLSLAQTQDLNYFEFSPSASQAIIVSAFSSVSQTFEPYNDFIDGFDIWADNSGASGNANFKVLNANDDVLVSKSITIPNIPLKWGGQKIHISFSPINVSSTSTYRLQVSSSLAKFQMYYVNKIDLLDHNAPYNFFNIVGPAYLGLTGQDFAFKFAIYENGDNLSPIVSNISFNALSDTQMQAGVNANEPVDLAIDYQTTYNSGQLNDKQSIPFTGNYNFCVESANPCKIAFNVLPNSTYNYQLYIRDYWGNQTVESGSFESSKNGVFNISPNSTSTPPASQILQIINPRVASITPTSAQIAWSTDVPAASRLLISLDASSTQVIARLGDNTFELEHLLDTGNVLNPNTLYYATIISDNFSNAIVGEVISFITPANNLNNNQPPAQQPNNPPPPPTTPPEAVSTNTISNLNLNQFTDVSNSLPNLNVSTSLNNSNGNNQNFSVNISWTAPLGGEPGNGYRIDIFDNQNVLQKKLTVLSGVHNATVDNLGSGNYRAVVYSDNNGNFQKVGKAASFTNKKKGFWESINFQTLEIIFAILAVLLFVTVILLKIIQKRKLLSNEIQN